MSTKRVSLGFAMIVYTMFEMIRPLFFEGVVCAIIRGHSETAEVVSSRAYHDSCRPGPASTM